MLVNLIPRDEGHPALRLNLPTWIVFLNAELTEDLKRWYFASILNLFARSMRVRLCIFDLKKWSFSIQQNGYFDNSLIHKVWIILQWSPFLRVSPDSLNIGEPFQGGRFRGRSSRVVQGVMILRPISSSRSPDYLELTGRKRLTYIASVIYLVTFVLTSMLTVALSRSYPI